MVNGGGSDAANGLALIDAVAEAGSNGPTAADPWTVFLEPGTFEITTDINVPDHVTLSGSGIDVTTVTSSVNVPGQSMIDIGVGALRDMTIEGTNQVYIVESDGSLRVESVKFVLVEGFSAIEFANGPHSVVDSEFSVSAAVNGIGISTEDADLHVRASSFTSLGGTSIELIYMEGGDVVVDRSTFEGSAVGIFSCCTIAGGDLTVRHSLIDVSRRAIVANLEAIDLAIESSTIIGVGTDVVDLNAFPSAAVVRGSTVVGGGVDSNGTATCRGTTVAAGFLSTTCP